ncbi:SET domain-containing protein [Peribacillus simplex]|uniref:SET domain-containing protein n=1 Tax=Peribacillus simplex TaxID=1478 RepID=UPI002852FA56|nr:SET domain-containing protein [Peribacillus simplex]MDR4924822.1 SET domain-containing protein [Peribacillus simplex]
MIHPDTEIRFVNEKIGVGIFATKMIPKGTIIWALDDLDIILEEDEIESLDIVRREIVYKYAYLNDDDRYVLCWDHARYMNHSFSPNVVSTVYEIEFASRDILPGEQITCDYASLGIDEPFECEPEEGTSSTVVMPDDYLHRYKEWDQLAREIQTIESSRPAAASSDSTGVRRQGKRDCRGTCRAGFLYYAL